MYILPDKIYKNEKFEMQTLNYKFRVTWFQKNRVIRVKMDEKHYNCKDWIFYNLKLSTSSNDEINRNPSLFMIVLLDEVLFVDL